MSAGQSSVNMLSVLLGVISIATLISAVSVPSDIGEAVLEAIYDDVQRVKNGSLSGPDKAACSVCYDELGCFDRCDGVFHYIRELPQSPDTVSTQFTMYSRNTSTEGVSFTFRDVTPAAKFLDAPRMLIFLVHGFSSGASEPWMIRLRENILRDDDALVITVDWSQGCKLPFYAQAVVNTQLVGREIAVVLNKLTQISPENVSPGTTHYIGHSLGAQMAMFFSEYFRSLTGDLLIGRITALDPAAPLLESYNVCLNSSSAIFIDGIHTSAGNKILRGELGVSIQVGHLDIYVNGGSKQPGCGFLDFTCAHTRSHDYYVEAARPDSSCTFKSYACVGGIAEYKAGKCRKVPGIYNSISLDASIAMPGRGVEFVDTRSSPPFCE